VPLQRREGALSSLSRETRIARQRPENRWQLTALDWDGTRLTPDRLVTGVTFGWKPSLFNISRQYIIFIVNYKENKKKDKGLINKRR